MSRSIDVLDVLFAVEEQEQEATEECLDSFAGWVVDNITLEFLGTKVGQRLGESVVESAAKHHKELEVC